MSCEVVHHGKLPQKDMLGRGQRKHWKPRHGHRTPRQHSIHIEEWGQLRGESKLLANNNLHVGVRLAHEVSADTYFLEGKRKRLASHRVGKVWMSTRDLQICQTSWWIGSWSPVVSFNTGSRNLSFNFFDIFVLTVFSDFILIECNVHIVHKFQRRKIRQDLDSDRLSKEPSEMQKWSGQV